MSEDQDRRIATLENHIERLYSGSKEHAERIIVMETRLQQVADIMRAAQADFRAQIAAMQGDFRAAQERAHRRTVAILTWALGGITIAVNLAGLYLSHLR